MAPGTRGVEGSEVGSWWADGIEIEPEQPRAFLASVDERSSSSGHEQVDRPGALGEAKPPAATNCEGMYSMTGTDSTRKGVMESRRDRSNSSEDVAGLAARRAGRQPELWE